MLTMSVYTKFDCTENNSNKKNTRGLTFIQLHWAVDIEDRVLLVPKSRHDVHGPEALTWTRAVMVSILFQLALPITK